MYKFNGWMMRTGAAFDRVSVEGWIGVQVQTSKYFLGLPAGTMGQVLGALELALNQYVIFVEWEKIEQATRRLDGFSREAAESYLLRLDAASSSA